MKKDIVNIKPMRKYDSDVRHQVANVFVDSYYKDLSIITKNKQILEEAFANALCEDTFYLAEVDGEIVGILACANNQQRAMCIERSKFRKALGFIKGNIAYQLLKTEFNMPICYPDNTTYIECVATKEKARGKGVATELFKYVMNELNYNHYVLEVIDTNQNAHRLYKKLGFKDFKREQVKFSKIKGFKEKIYMEWNR